MGARYHVLSRAAKTSHRVQAWAHRLSGYVDVATQALLHASLNNLEKEALSIELYNASFRKEETPALYDWEETWFARRLPKAPARLLIGAAGGGREAAVLQARGYHVHAFEPAQAAFLACRDALGADARVDLATYADFIEGTLALMPQNNQNKSHYDAVLLGWGSFGHILDMERRSVLLRRCHEVVKEGPILLSIFHPSVRPLPKPIARGLRRMTGDETDLSRYAAWGGFMCEPTFEELEAHAASIGRRVIVCAQPNTSYATLIK